MQFPTKMARATLVGASITLACGLFLLVINWPDSGLSTRYYYSGPVAEGHDFSSPAVRSWLIFSDSYPSEFRASYRKTAETIFQDRCHVEKIMNKFDSTSKDRPLGLIYRDVKMCNAAGLSGIKFDYASEEFKRQVDEEYFRYYTKDILNHILFSIGTSIGILFSVFGCVFIGRWVLRGK